MLWRPGHPCSGHPCSGGQGILAAGIHALVARASLQQASRLRRPGHPCSGHPCSGGQGILAAGIHALEARASLQWASMLWRPGHPCSAPPPHPFSCSSSSPRRQTASCWFSRIPLPTRPPPPLPASSLFTAPSRCPPTPTKISSPGGSRWSPWLSLLWAWGREGGRGEAAQAVFLTFTKLQLYYSFSFFCLTSYLSSPGETELGPPRCKFYLVSF